MSNFAAVLDILANNQADIENLIAKFGGIGNVIRAAPSLINIMQTLAKHRDPVEAAQTVERVLAYNADTMEKVKAFQKKNGLTADGIIGNATWTKVESLLPKGHIQ